MAGGKTPITTNLDMGGYRILNVAHPRNPREYESDLVTSKILYDYMSRVDQNYIRRDKDGSLDGRLNMSNHKTSGLADPTDANDAVTRRYVASRFQALSDEVQDKKSKLDALQNLFGVENNHLLIRKYEITGTDFEHVGVVYGNVNNKESDVVVDKFNKYAPGSGDFADYEFFDIFMLKEYFFFSSI